MKPADVQVIGEHLAIKWDDGTESFLALAQLRRHCPCAGCRGEADIMGNIYRGVARELTEASVRLARIQAVGGYALQPVWEDGHSTGIYAYDYLRKLGALAGEETGQD